MGLGRAMELVLTGREIGAEEGERWGLVNRVVDDGKGLSPLDTLCLPVG